MGVLNVTPDSFSDGGLHATVEAAVAHGVRMVEEGADIIDVGGESTRPGSDPVTVADELERVLPVIAALRGELGETPIAVDTRRPEVMREAVAAGATLINDVAALREPGALEAAAECDVPVCLMHMLGEPKTMQREPRYDDVVAEVCEFLRERRRAAVRAGIDRDRIVLDPGFGFGKTLAHNLMLLAELERIVALGSPVLVGLSRKSMFGMLLGLEVDERLEAGLAAALMAAERGAAIVRTHDVAATHRALGVYAAITSATRKPPLN